MSYCAYCTLSYSWIINQFVILPTKEKIWPFEDSLDTKLNVVWSNRNYNQNNYKQNFISLIFLINCRRDFLDIFFRGEPEARWNGKVQVGFDRNQGFNLQQIYQYSGLQPSQVMVLCNLYLYYPYKAMRNFSKYLFIILDHQ